MVYWLVAFFGRFNHEHLLFLVIIGITVFLLTSTRRSNRRCPRCKDVNRDHAVYCAQCGARLREK